MSTHILKLSATSCAGVVLLSLVSQNVRSQQTNNPNSTVPPANQRIVSTQNVVTITVDAQAARRAINPLIYGVAHAGTEQLQLLNAPLNRSGGNNTSRYNWKLNADNRGGDWFFESIGDEKAEPGERADSFIARSKAAGAQPMWTIPLLDWVAKIGPNRAKLASYSIAKYGAQQKTDQYMPDAGNGLQPDGSHIEGNDPADANTRNSPEFQQEFVQHLVAKWGAAAKGGLRYYIMDNEPAIWHSTHRDVQPVGVTMQELVDKTVAYSNAVKAVDAGALVVGPEEWGWSGYFLSGYDSQEGPRLNWDRAAMTDRRKMGGMDALPWYLQQLRSASEISGKRVLDVFTVHIYPQGGEFGDDVSRDMQLRRNRSTRALWDPNYKDETWINDTVQLIPRLKEWVAKHYYDDTPTGITEYNWGAENHINGATTQADIYGIFGREGLDMGARWTTPAMDTPTFKAMQMYRNYDGKKNGFGETSVRATAPNADEVSAFAATRKADGALTIVVVNKKLSEGDTTSTRIALNVKNFKAKGAAQAWQLASENQIKKLTDAKLQNGKLAATVPNGSVTMFVVAAAS
ncbi:MAG TPA: glycoside hydrolase family 44 protein [Abditibacteriaceae bacterium]|jgi:hypothetical protein